MPAEEVPASDPTHSNCTSQSSIRIDMPWSVFELEDCASSECASFITGGNLVTDDGLTASLPTSPLNEVYQADEQPARE